MSREKTAEPESGLKKKKDKKDPGRIIQEYLSDSSSPEEVLFKINEILFARQYESTRRYMRAPVALEVTFKVLGKTYNSSSYSLSQRGMFIKSPSPPPVGVDIEVDFTLPDGGGLVHAEGEVVHASALQQAMKQSSILGMSVVFRKIKPEDRRRIDKLVRSRTRKSKKRAG